MPGTIYSRLLAFGQKLLQSGKALVMKSVDKIKGMLTPKVKFKLGNEDHELWVEKGNDKNIVMMASGEGKDIRDHDEVDKLIAGSVELKGKIVSAEKKQNVTISDAQKIANGLQAASKGESKPKFSYKHDPSKNPKVLQDAYQDTSAVYGYRPRPDGSLKSFADRDWSDPKFVAEARAKRIAYHIENENTAKEISVLRNQYSDEQVARILVDRRNNTRLNSYIQEGKVIDQAGYDQAKQHSKTYEQLRKEGKSDLDIINSSIRSNPGMDACTGLYDDYFDTYIGEK